MAYDFKTGKRIWQTAIADPKIGETVPAAPIAWNGLVFAGNAGGDIKGVKGRMYALDAKTGRIVWEFYLVPKTAGDRTRGPQAASPLDTSTWKNAPGIPITGGATWTSYTLDPATGLLYMPGGNPAPDFATRSAQGCESLFGICRRARCEDGAYRNHFKIVPVDWHDWDVSNTPAIIHSRGGKKILVVTPKNGFLYGFDLSNNDLLYRMPVTRIENATATFSTGNAVHFCPGSTGGAEWNGPAYDPQTNLIYIGEVDWCTTVTLLSEKSIAGREKRQALVRRSVHQSLRYLGQARPFRRMGGLGLCQRCRYGRLEMARENQLSHPERHDADGRRRRVLRRHGRKFLRGGCGHGRKLWGQKIGGAIGGGVITYTAEGEQKVAVATGLTEVLWPTDIMTAKVVILGLEQDQ